MTNDELPDPQGEPQAEKNDWFGNAIWLGFAAVVAVGVVASPLGMGRAQVRGASRSGRVKWAERQDEIEKTLSTQNNEPKPVDGTKR